MATDKKAPVKAEMMRQLKSRKHDRTVVRPYQLPNHLGYLLHETSRMRRAIFDKALRPLGITRAQWWLLATLSNLPEEGVSQNRLAAAMDANKVTVGVMLRLLESNGFVTRDASSTDKRANLIRITLEGYRVLDQTRVIAQYINGATVRSLSPAQQEHAEDALRTVRTNLIDLLDEF